LYTKISLVKIAKILNKTKEEAIALLQSYKNSRMISLKETTFEKNVLGDLAGCTYAISYSLEGETIVVQDSKMIQNISKVLQKILTELKSLIESYDDT